MKPVRFPTRRTGFRTTLMDAFDIIAENDAAFVLLIALFIGGTIGWVDMLMNLFQFGMR